MTPLDTDTAENRTSGTIQALGGAAVLLCVLLGVAMFGCDRQTQTEKDAALHRIAMDRADVHLEAEEYQQAVEQYTAAINLDPDSAAAYVGQGNVYVDLADYEAAIESYDQALSLRPEDPEARRNRGLAYLGLGRLTFAIEDFDEAVRRNIADVPARMARNIAVSQKEALDEIEGRSAEYERTKGGNQPTRVEMDDDAIRMLRRY